MVDFKAELSNPPYMHIENIWWISFNMHIWWISFNMHIWWISFK